MRADDDVALLRRFEPVVRYTKGERFFPLDVEPYVRASGLWVRPRGGDAVELTPPGSLSLEGLAQATPDGVDTVAFLKLTDPLPLPALASYRFHEYMAARESAGVFHAGQGRLARVGYVSRLADAVFSLSLLARGRVPGDTAAAAAITYREMLAAGLRYRYHGRVVRQDSWVVLQYWFFYVFNDWRSGFFGANDHEADWEMISVYLAETPEGDLAPEWVAYASHDYSGDDLRRRWDDPELEKVGEHPVVYAGAGSHASYYRAGEYLTELEVPWLRRVGRVAEHVQAFWYEQLRQYRASAAPGEPAAGRSLRIPFVDYARGDGLSIGPDQPVTWAEPRLLSPPPPWVSEYRGLWGYYARDPFAGEDAPAGPMYNRDGTVRRSWYDPVGWAGLDKVPPPSEVLPTLLGRRMAVAEQQRALAATIESKNAELRSLGMELAAMAGQRHLQAVYDAGRTRLSALAEELARLRADLASGQAALEALDQYAARLAAGARPPARAHIRRPHRPISKTQLRAARLAETWAAISIGLLLVAIGLLAFFARAYLAIGLVYAVAAFALIEAGFRGRITQLVARVTVVLAVVSAGVLLWEFFWQIAIIAVVAFGLYILWINVRELLQ